MLCYDTLRFDTICDGVSYGKHVLGIAPVFLSFAIYWRLAVVPASAGAGGQAGRGRRGPLPCEDVLPPKSSSLGRNVEFLALKQASRSIFPKLKCSFIWFSDMSITENDFSETSCER